MNQPTEEQLRESVKLYRWYHTIEVSEGIFTDSSAPHFKRMWDFNLKCLRTLDFRGKRVLDVGCRDGLFSFFAEQQGAREVIGIDNDLSKGAVEFLIPHFRSKVKMHELNLYDLTPAVFGKFDIVLFLGVLYHLRHPFWGLRKIADCLVDQGLLVIETAMLEARSLKHLEILYCPVERSPYEPTSCAFFNQLGLEVTLRSMNVHIDQKHVRPKDTSRFRGLSNLERTVRRLIRKKVDVPRQLFVCRNDPNLEKTEISSSGKTTLPKEKLTSYWDATHELHSRKKQN